MLRYLFKYAPILHITEAIQPSVFREFLVNDMDCQCIEEFNTVYSLTYHLLSNRTPFLKVAYI
jgi:hypothetical protein